MVPPSGTPTIGFDRVRFDISQLVLPPAIILPLCSRGMTPLEILHGIRSVDRQSVWITMLTGEGGLNMAVVRNTDLLSEVTFRVTLQAP